MGTMMSVIWWSNNSNLNVADSTCVGDVRNELTGDANCVSKSGNARFQSIGDGQRDQLAKVAAKLGESVGEEHTSLTDASVINQAGAICKKFWPTANKYINLTMRLKGNWYIIQIGLW
ncbi:hypothetical protein KY290_036217 [Solanum tuberosum]|uniref:Uncharacterized protein n=1 Tax=Solanum tuberosum TaxID=4113 RepID=A0ABQ7TS13_SOLTU|nr:hypothetical protein KY290_036217 [Solanum tuberosum]